MEGFCQCTLVGGSEDYDLYRFVHGKIDLALLVMGAKNVLRTKPSYPLLARSTHHHQNILIEKARDILLCSVGAQALFFRCRRSFLFGGGLAKRCRIAISDDGASLFAQARIIFTSSRLSSQRPDLTIPIDLDRALMISVESQNLVSSFLHFRRALYVASRTHARHQPLEDTVTGAIHSTTLVGFIPLQAFKTSPRPTNRAGS